MAFNPQFSKTASFSPYLASLALIGGVSLAAFKIDAGMVHANVAMLYLLVVVVSGLRWGRAPAIVTAVGGALAFDFFFVPPLFTFAFGDSWYMITLAGLLAVGLAISALAGEAREQAQTAQKREVYTAALYSFSQSLALASEVDRIVQTLTQHLAEAFGREVLVVLRDESAEKPCFSAPGFQFGEQDRAAASWVLENGQHAGRGAERFTEAQAFYLPLKTSSGVVGAVGLNVSYSEKWLNSERNRLLEAFVSQAAVAIERALLERKARDARLLQEAARLQKALLNSISHNLRTPLATINGALSSLLEDHGFLSELTKRELLETAEEEAGRLNRLVRNLLDMTRLEAGAMRVRAELCEMVDVVGAALAQLGDETRHRQIVVDLPQDLPMAPMDFVLITQVLVNLIDNAVKYSPPGSPVHVGARIAAEHLEILVQDHGPGIPQRDLERVFEKFYRAAPGESGGIGLGLSICKGFVEAHAGCIWAERCAPAGTVVTFTLPLTATRVKEEIDERAGAASSNN